MAAERAPLSPVIESPAGRGYDHDLSKWVCELGETIIMMTMLKLLRAASLSVFWQLLGRTPFLSR
eukprot:1893392-Prymnesium_polylepis.1